ncbi:MAG: hypothetical protein EON90_13935 [Brevundimonas sp.]|nr:MAG: hypothetical protein EON90_13935 [Brevundimonas sp.]
MRNPALRLVFLSVISILTQSCATTNAATQSTIKSGVENNSIDVRNRIIASSSAGPRLDIEIGPTANGGVATLAYKGEVQRVTKTGCPALKTALDVWRAFPPINLGPRALRNDPPATQIPPALVDGYGGWTIQTEAAVPDSFPVTVTIDARSGRYGIWAEETVRGIMRCPESP